MPSVKIGRKRTHDDGWQLAPPTKFPKQTAMGLVATAGVAIDDPAGKRLLGDVDQALRWYPGAVEHDRQAPSPKEQDLEVARIEALAGQLREALAALTSESRSALEMPPAVRSTALQKRQAIVARWRREINGATDLPTPRLRSIQSVDWELAGLERACTIVRYHFEGKESRGAKPDHARRRTLGMLAAAFDRAAAGRVDPRELAGRRLDFLVKACRFGNIPLPRRDRIDALLSVKVHPIAPSESIR